jgi:3-hydroxyisobutyrate dehydrogenase-like beta-hydroxyacid dehydrogenase
MGALMASNLADWLHATHRPPLTLWNRTASKLPPASDKIVHAKSIKEMANLDIILTSLSSDEAVKDIYQQLLDGVREKEKAREGHGAHEKGTYKSTIFVETSTVYPDTSGELEREASSIPHTYFVSLNPSRRTGT